MIESRAVEERGEVLLEIRGLKTHFISDEGVSPAVDGVDLHVHRGKRSASSASRAAARA